MNKLKVYILDTCNDRGATRTHTVFETQEAAHAEMNIVANALLKKHPSYTFTHAKYDIDNTEFSVTDEHLNEVCGFKVIESVMPLTTGMVAHVMSSASIKDVAEVLAAANNLGIKH